MHQHRASLPVSMTACRVLIIQSYFYHRALAASCQVGFAWSYPSAPFKKLFLCQAAFVLSRRHDAKAQSSPAVKFLSTVSRFYPALSLAACRQTWVLQPGSLSCLEVQRSSELWPLCWFAKLFRCTEGASSRPMPPQIFTRLRGPPSVTCKLFRCTPAAAQLPSSSDFYPFAAQQLKTQL